MTDGLNPEERYRAYIDRQQEQSGKLRAEVSKAVQNYLATFKDLDDDAYEAAIDGVWEALDVDPDPILRWDPFTGIRRRPGDVPPWVTGVGVVVLILFLVAMGIILY